MGRMKRYGGREEPLAISNSTRLCEARFSMSLRGAERRSKLCDGQWGRQDQRTKLTGDKTVAILLLMAHSPVLLRVKS